MKSNDLQYSKSTIALSATLLIVGIAYGIYTGKPLLTVMILAFAGSVIGLGIGTANTLKTENK